jgi:DnaK suppressor protein
MPKSSTNKSPAKPSPAKNNQVEKGASSQTKPKAAKRHEPVQEEDGGPDAGPVSTSELLGNAFVTPVKTSDDSKLKPFLRKQKEKLLNLRDAILDSMMGVAKDNLRSRAEGSEASAFGMHQADAGSDAYDRDFALNLLSQEQDALYEIDQALKRIENDTYGICEISGKPIPHARLEAIPFARYTVECQAEIEKQMRGQRIRRPVTSLFGLTDDEPSEGDEEETGIDTKE